MNKPIVSKGKVKKIIHKVSLIKKNNNKLLNVFLLMNKEKYYFPIFFYLIKYILSNKTTELILINTL